MTPPRLTLLALLLAFTITGCEMRTGGDEADAGGGADAATDGGADDGGLPGPFTTCVEGGLTECFSNHDCPTEAVCLDVGVSPEMVPCCVTGSRGALAVGETCDTANGERECASSLCVEGSTEARCTDTCTADTDCPAGMQNCTFIAFSGSSDQWCLFE